MDGSQPGFLAFSDSKAVDRNTTDKQVCLTSSQNPISTITPESNWASRKLWTSIWLRRDTLLVFFTLFTSLCITLVLLMHYNIKENGFALALSTNWYIHYTWTYALTVVFTIIASLWRQVDYHCKLSQPWSAMRQGPEVPSKTVLLDYISPLQTTSLWRAFKNKHWAVVLSILGSIILQGIIVTSTTVFIPSPTTLTGTFSATITTRFNGTEYLNALTSSKTEVSVPLLPFEPINQQPTYDVPNLPLKLYQDILSDDSPSPPEIQDGVVVRLFNHTTDKKVTQITAPTQAFVPNITCEELDNVTFVDYSALRFTFILNSSSCSIGEWSSVARLNFGQVSQYEMNRVNCSAGSPIQETSQNAQAVINSTSTDDLRFLLTAIEIKRTDHSNSNHPNDQTWKFLRMTAVLCKVDYSIQDLDLTEFPEDNSFALSPTYNPDENHRIHNLSSIQLGEIIYSMLLDPSVQDDAATADASISDSIFSHPIFHLMRLASKVPSAESSRFFDAKTMMQAFVTSFCGLACQLIQMKFMLLDQAPGEGKGLYIDERLYAQALSTWIISACLITLSIISFGLVFIAPRESSPQNPSLLASHSTVLASSPSMQAVLKAAGSLRTSELTRWLQNFKFQTSITDSDENGNVITESKKFNDCPSTSIIFGHLGPDRTSTENVTALVCFQEIQIVKTEVSFGFERTDPRSILKLSHSNIRCPPIVDESTAVLMTNAQGLSSLSFSISTNIARVEWEWANDEPGTDWSNFFVPIAYGPNMPRLDAMLGPNNTQLLIDTVDRLYNMYMVRVITSPIFRKPLNGSTKAAAQQLTGTVSTTVPRLKVDHISKLILQILLGTMIISGALGFSLTRIRGTLPRSPFSIASQMALFAGSEVCEPKNMPAGAEWMTKRELETLFGNWQFGLGWWEVPSDCKDTPENGPRDSQVTRWFGIDIGTPEHRRFTRERGMRYETDISAFYVRVSRE
ncbi:hypothetical protein Daesc_007649 [Daldinia eschscholtzii]|uniref:Transmembrane protein n=1 Tax=Daldinia eschscholtzii TaxID=292717 RepID=A0AAX6MER3_9PEZI